MRRLDAIKERLDRATSEETDTDAKLESGAIVDWVEHCEDDVLWLLERVSELRDILWALLRWDIDNQIPNDLHEQAKAAITGANIEEERPIDTNGQPAA